jgi:FixJ family two-component response regulator
MHPMKVINRSPNNLKTHTRAGLHEESGNAVRKNRSSRKPGRICNESHLVFVVGNESDSISRLVLLLEASGIKVRCLKRTDQLLAGPPPSCPSCLILDNKPGDGIQGLGIHRQLVECGWCTPILFLNTCGDVRTVVMAMRNGASNYLAKPFDPDELMEAVFNALEHSRDCLRKDEKAAQARRRFSNLSARERDIVKLVISGHLNKEIADQLNLALVTVKVHRGRAMRKLRAGNAAELAQIASLAETGPA